MRWIRPSPTRSTAALFATAALDAVVFYAIFMVVLPWLFHRLLPVPVDLPFWPRVVTGAVLFAGGLGLCMLCVDVFVRRGRGTPLPAQAPRHLVTTGPFAVIRNPIIAGEVAAIWGEALYFASLGVLAYAVLFTLLGHVNVLYVEEPELRRRFGSTGGVPPNNRMQRTRRDKVPEVKCRQRAADAGR
jgi:protein-S-isoprenylcysteine O-methyltransferase Ste14